MCSDLVIKTYAPQYQGFSQSFSHFSLSLHSFLSMSIFPKASGLRRQLSSPLNAPGEHTGKPRNPAHDFSDDEDDFSSHSSDSPQDDVILRKNSKLPHNRVRMFKDERLLLVDVMLQCYC